MEILYQDDRLVVCLKPYGVVSTDEPGGMPSLLRLTLGEDQAVIRTVHRLDQVVGGVMVYACTSRAASDLQRQMEQGLFQKEYWAVVPGEPDPVQGDMSDLLYRDSRLRKTFVVQKPGKDVRPASLSYEVLGQQEGFSLVSVKLHTGRTHQIRCQFASRGMPLVGDRKYGSAYQREGICLWSQRLSFHHPRTDEPLTFVHRPPDEYPWNLFLP
jgi:23S rRNA pseudouridine1911/1915/1917 synthase